MTSRPPYTPAGLLLLQTLAREQSKNPGGVDALQVLEKAANAVLRGDADADPVVLARQFHGQLGVLVGLGFVSQEFRPNRRARGGEQYQRVYLTPSGYREAGRESGS